MTHDDFDPIQDFSDDIPPTFRDRINIFLQDVKHFPALLIEKIQNNSFGSIKVWGIGVFLFIIYLIWSSSGFAAVYYSYKIDREMSSIESTETWIENRSEDLQKSKKYLRCLQSQMMRIAKDQKVEILFCDK